MFRLKQLYTAIPLFAVIALFGSDNTQFLRRLASDCVHSVYATSETVKKIPAVPESGNGGLPAYISLCQQWLRNDAYYNETSKDDSYRVVEDDSVCSDWSAPHYNMLDIQAALIVTAQIKRIKYRHNCDRTRLYDEATMGFDHTTIQQVMNTPGIGTNKNIFSTEDVKQQCRRCLLQFDPQVESVRIKSKAVHHCLAWPADETRVLDATTLPFSPSKNNPVTAFSSIIHPFRQRIYHAAMEWQNVTDKPPGEETGGLVIQLDPTSIGLDFATVAAEIEQPVTSISILSGPTCATAVLPTGQICHEYGKGLRDYLAAEFSSLSTNGWNGGSGVTFKIVASSAASNSRMTLAKKLLCPPRTPSCYFPAVSKIKDAQTAKILEDPSWMMAVDFFTIAGTHGVVTVKVLDASQIPATYTAEPARRIQETGIADQFNYVNAMSDSEGYPDGVSPPVMASDQDIVAMTDQQILDDIAIALNRFLDNPNVYHQRLEMIPTMQMIQDAIANKEPLHINSVEEYYYPKNDDGNGPRSAEAKFRSGELTTDQDSGRSQPPPGVEYWETSSARRHESLLRIQADWETSFYGHIQDNRAGEDPSTIYEIFCPELIENGAISYLDGTATTTTTSAIIIAGPDGISIRDAETGEVTGTGLASVPVGTAFNKDGDYQLKDPFDDQGTARARRVVQLETGNDLPFTEELERVCKHYANRRSRSLNHKKRRNNAVDSIENAADATNEAIMLGE
eukprot:CAMPEP_0119007368 /NCGR_PEP_ID=MMETSP1176-20130426/2962_1 /TAXON_ID=265551 /ORGANISM="Synedropsis recta cf, Strain CCMP1620" /LENGTH=735 /DNA_ID=CAMNT_0006959497 /DNA_START=76 /DNA_END=2283 /DNA_ORIENTATION=-